MDKFPDMVLMQKISPKNLWRVSRSVICFSALTVFHFLTPQALLSQSLVCKVNWISLSRFRLAILAPLPLTYCASISPSFFHHSCLTIYVLPNNKLLLHRFIWNHSCNNQNSKIMIILELAFLYLKCNH